LSSFFLRRLLMIFPTTLGVVVVVFLAFHLVPGDPAVVMLAGSHGSERASGDFEARVAEFRRRQGLDRSLWIQLLDTIGPFNLGRDGHPWFDSPRSERVLEVIEARDGGRIVEGLPLPIDDLPRTAPELAAELQAAVRVLTVENSDEAAREQATQRLREAGEESLPALLSALNDSRASASGEEIRARLAQALTRVTGHDGVVSPERVELLGGEAQVRHWFGWYYTHGGRRVRNSGERPWGGLLALDLGHDLRLGTSIAAELGRRLAVTVPLALAAVLLSYLIALPLGILCALRRGSRIDSLIALLLFLLYSVPTFWAGLMLILLFGVTGPDWPWWPRLPILGLHDQDAAQLGAWAYGLDTLRHSILPVAALTYGSLAYLSRQMRSSMIEVLVQDYIRMARAKGLPERWVVGRHALRNALIPIVTLFASVLPSLIGGSVIVETVFDLPGMGKYAFEGLLGRDIHVVMATTILVALMTQLGILFSDVVYTWVDPRIRYTRRIRKSRPIRNG
jgi:peptide/nickel transport system permease protein